MGSSFSPGSTCEMTPPDPSAIWGCISCKHDLLLGRKARDVYFVGERLLEFIEGGRALF